jgi:hypothetical protein
MDTIIQDIKKLFKELENVYGSVKPQICDISGIEKCPNTKCWVQKIRDEYSDKISDLNAAILNSIMDLVSISQLKNSPDCNYSKQLEMVIKKLDNSINDTPCQKCSKRTFCDLEYKKLLFHKEDCPLFHKALYDKENETNKSIHF